MQVEMIRQKFNHPSMIMWCYMNEVLLRPHFNDDKPSQKKYFVNRLQDWRGLEASRVGKTIRYTMMANHGNL